jgi:glyoxylase-like metal-dependent hydrolase (beta-lactamase superfamily II)
VKIHALSTGTVRLKHAFLYAKSGPRRQLDLFLPGKWSDPVPIHCWAVEHAGQVFLIDTGETAGVRDIPFARFDVRSDQELPSALAAVGLSVGGVDTAVITHMHGDHMDGGIHVDGPVLVHERELEFSRTRWARIAQRLFRQPVPAGVDFTPIALDGGSFGAFERSKRLSEDGRIVAVSTPGHTPGHMSVVCVDDEGRHVFLAGDTTDTLEQLQARRPDAVSPKPAVAVATMETILAHGREHPTVYLPAHDVDSVARLESGATL